MVRAIYPGSFDPVTNGHLDIIERASRAFDHLIVAVLENPRKVSLFKMEERVAMLKIITKKFSNVNVDSYNGLLVDYADKVNASIIVKGLRAVSDFEIEFQMALANRKLNSKVETLFMMTNNIYSFVSSSIVKEVAGYGGNIRDMVPKEVHQIIVDKINSVKNA
ncbi:MAG: pantetheine-phosphate adenylyltransferase [Firmicutes bacterium]|nr:pantetheine-phosphate adenylyltransferase [Bacillota bacterium]